MDLFFLLQSNISFHLAKYSNIIKASDFRSERTQKSVQSCTYLLHVLFDLARDERVVDDCQDHGRVVAGDPAAHQQPAVCPIAALREEDFEHHDFSSVFNDLREQKQ